MAETVTFVYIYKYFLSFEYSSQRSSPLPEQIVFCQACNIIALILAALNAHKVQTQI